MKIATVLATLIVVAVSVHFGWIDPHAAPLVGFVGMAFPADALDVVDLRALADGGFIREDVYRKTFFLQTAADTPFTNLIGTDPCNSDKTEWTFDNIRAPSVSNAAVAASNPASFATATGSRVSNRSQIFRGAISVSSTARASQLAGNVEPLAFETNKELMALRQDVEATMLTHQASVVGDNNATAQKTGGFSAWLATNDGLGTGGSSGGYNASTHVVDAPTVGVGRALSWAYVTAQILATYIKRSNVQYAMSTPALIAGINAAIVAGTIKAAVPTATMPAGTPTTQTANAYFSGIITAFGTILKFIPNRTQQAYTGGGTSSNVVSCVDLFGIDPAFVSIGYHEGYKVTDLGATSGLRTDRDITVSACMMPRREDAHFVIRSINPSLAVTA